MMCSYLSRLCVGLVCAGVFSGCAPVPLQNPPEAAYEPVPAPPMPRVEVQAPTGAIFNPVTAQELFRDIKAYRIGDVLTIMLEENTNAEMSSATNTSKDDTNALGASLLFGREIGDTGSPLQVKTSNNRSFSGNGSSSQSNRVTGQISVTVYDVLSNGNLIVRGEKRTTINQGLEFLRISGIVRPEDVSDSNEVRSSRIANAYLSYGGRGAVRDSNRTGWASRFFNSEWWPF